MSILKYKKICAHKIPKNNRNFEYMEYYYKAKLESERIVTRFLVPADAMHWCDFVRSKDATEFFPEYYAPENPLPAAEKFLSSQFTRYEEKTYGLKALIEKETGNFIGLCGLLGKEVDGNYEIEIGYQLLPQYWGKGYAAEAARLFMDFAIEHQLIDSLISIIDVGNVKSERVAEKNGFKRDKKTLYQGLDVWVYRRELPSSK